MAVKLYGYFRSSAAYRVRIALNLKGIEAEHIYIHLRRDEQNVAEYKRLNPAGLVPTLEHDGRVIVQSLAIIEYLEELQPEPRLLPKAPEDRAHVRALALSIATDLHPLNNLRVLNYLRHTLGVDVASKDAWYAHWVEVGLTTFERMLASDPRTGSWCCGDEPGLADICLVPQVFSAERMKCDLSPFPTITRIVANARHHPAFAAAAPEAQADAE